MATYKVIQDIEAEDKLVGPLTLRQFIYAAVAAVCLYICFLCFKSGAEFLIGIFLPVAAGAAFFAFPWKGEQPTELWALARLRFTIKPRVRIWDQEGAKDLVSITVPRKLKTERVVRPALSQNEVRSRLKALAETIDSRGWATRNAAYGIYGQNWSRQATVPAAPNPGMAALIPDDDMFSDNTTVSQNLDALLAKSQQDQRQRVMDRMANAQAPARKLAQLPAIPTPAASSAYTVAPAPAPMPVRSNQLAAATMPAMNPPAPANYWFANGPAYPVNPVGQTPAAPAMAPPLSPAMAMPALAPAAPTMPYIPPAPGPLPATMAGSGSVPSLPAVVIPSMAAPMSPPPAMAPGPSPAPAGMPPLAGMQPPAMAPAPQPSTQPASEPDPGQAPPQDPRIESDMPMAAPATPTSDETAAVEELKRQNDEAMTISYGHMRVLQPQAAGGSPDQAGAAPATSIDTYQPQPAADGVAAGDQFVNGMPFNPFGMPGPAPAPVTAPPNPAILELANNDDLDIATLARQANRELNKAPDEVEIRLH